MVSVASNPPLSPAIASKALSHAHLHDAASSATSRFEHQAQQPRSAALDMAPASAGPIVVLSSATVHASQDGEAKSSGVSLPHSLRPELRHAREADPAVDALFKRQSTITHSLKALAFRLFKVEQRVGDSANGHTAVISANSLQGDARREQDAIFRCLDKHHQRNAHRGGDPQPLKIMPTYVTPVLYAASTRAAVAW